MDHVSESSKNEILFESIRMTRLAGWVYGTEAGGFPGDQPPLEEMVTDVIEIGSAEQSTQGAAIITPDKLYLVFRGSESIFSSEGLKDWKLNFKFLKKCEFYGIKAHRGFVSAAEQVLDQVRQIIDANPSKQLIEIGGHSLGGNVAVAVAVAVNYWLREATDRRQVKLITLGQPKFSRKRQLSLALRFVPYIRIQNGSDIVARLAKLGYSHAGMNLYLANSGKLLWNPGTARKFFDRLFTLRQRGSDHSTRDYLNELLSHAKTA